MMTDIEQIKAKLDLAAEVAKIIKLRRSGKVFVGCCLLHSQRASSFHVYDDQSYHCYGCQAHGCIIDFVARTRSIDATRAPEAGIEHQARDESSLRPSAAPAAFLPPY